MHLALKKTKKILIVSECFFPEEFKINEVAFDWAQRGHNVTILTLAPTYPSGRIFSGYRNKLFFKENYKGLTIYRVWAVTGYRENFIKKILRFINFMCLGSLVSLALGSRYDYIFGFNTGALTSMLPAVICNQIYRKPLLLWVQDLWPDSLYAFGLKKNRITEIVLDNFVRFMHRRVAAIAVSAKGFESKLRAYVKPNVKFLYFPNWAEELDPHSKPAFANTLGLVNFTFAGNIGKQQNLDLIASAFSTMSEKYRKKAQLNIVGDGPKLDELKTKFLDDESIVFHGPQERATMSSFYQASDFLIVSLVDDPVFAITVPSKTQTYIAAKKPILAIINGETADLVIDKSLGLHADPSNVKEIEHLFQSCIDMDDHEKKKYLTQNDYLLSTIFSKKKTISGLLDVLLSSETTT